MDDPAICLECIANDRFYEWIARNGRDGKCEVNPKHSGQSRVASASALAEIVDLWFRANYQIGEMEPYFDSSDRMNFDQRGDTYPSIFCEELGCEEAVVEVLKDHLPDASSRDIAQGADTFYNDGDLFELISEYEKREAQKAEEFWYENRIYFQWQDFCKAAIYGKRFFGLQAQLDELFGDPKEFEDGALRPIYEVPAGQKIFRARLLDDTSLEEKVRLNPAGELGAPPRDRARAGRMNVEFIPAFYGAFNEDTAVAEIRPGIGEIIGIGEFEVQQPLRVFDFTVFSRVRGETLHQAIAHTRYEFIDQMEGEISKPILPYDKQREYIPTQIVAEYLGECFGCDAVIYRSSMVKEYDKESRNIVLLNKGVPFSGEPNSPLSFRRHEIREVGNIIYQLSDYIPF